MMSELINVLLILASGIVFYITLNMMVKDIMSQFITNTNYRIANLEEKVKNLKQDIDDLEFDLNDRISNL